MTKAAVEGGCLCGAVRYCASGEASHPTLCHCASCRRAAGAPLTYQHASHPGEIDVTVASLDDPAAFPPADHTWMSERIAWLELGDGLPRHPRSRFG